MKLGAATLELDVTLRFNSEGTLSGVHEISFVGPGDMRIELSEELQRDLYRELRDLRPFDAVLDACRFNAEDERDDLECDEERIARVAS